LINDHRPYFLKNFYRKLEYLYTRNFIAPQLADLGEGHHFMKPWNIRLYGRCISIGRNAHIVTAGDRQVSLATWTFEDHQGQIVIGDQCLLCPGVRIDSAAEVRIGDNSMIAAGAYLTDADWHDIYDRTRPVGNTAAIQIAENVWIGDGATICKGVSVGKNSIIGASSVVAQDIPENSIAVGNPAKVVKTLDPDREIITRAQMFENPDEMAAYIDRLDRYLLKDNSFLNWIRMLFSPRRGD
jgi:acetyltransferase-like isoleucine patch superfamily enzyme